MTLIFLTLCYRQLRVDVCRRHSKTAFSLMCLGAARKSLENDDHYEPLNYSLLISHELER